MNRTGTTDGDAELGVLRTGLVALNAAVAVFFTVAFAFALAGRGTILDSAKAFAADKTHQLAEPAVRHAERLLEQPFARGQAADALRRQVAHYRTDPRGFVGELVGTVRAADPEPAGRFEAELVRLKERLRDHFERVIDRLVLDLRIFTGSSAAGALLGVVLALLAPAGRESRLLPYSAALLMDVIGCAVHYVDGYTFWRMLFDTYAGWWYPAILALVAVELYLRAFVASDGLGGNHDTASRPKTS